MQAEQIQQQIRARVGTPEEGLRADACASCRRFATISAALGRPGSDGNRRQRAESACPPGAGADRAALYRARKESELGTCAPHSGESRKERRSGQNTAKTGKQRAGATEYGEEREGRTAPSAAEYGEDRQVARERTGATEYGEERERRAESAEARQNTAKSGRSAQGQQNTAKSGKDVETRRGTAEYGEERQRGGDAQGQQNTAKSGKSSESGPSRDRILRRAASVRSGPMRVRVRRIGTATRRTQKPSKIRRIARTIRSPRHGKIRKKWPARSPTCSGHGALEHN